MYDPAALDQPLNRLRFMTGDTDDPGLMADEEVLSCWEPARGLYTCAADLLDAMAAKCGAYVDNGAEGVVTRFSQQAEAYRKQAASYRATARANGEAGTVAPSGLGQGGGGALLVGGEGEPDRARFWLRYGGLPAGGWVR